MSQLFENTKGINELNIEITFNFESCYVLQEFSVELRLQNILIYEIEYDYKIYPLYQIYTSLKYN